MKREFCENSSFAGSLCVYACLQTAQIPILIFSPMSSAWSDLNLRGKKGGTPLTIGTYGDRLSEK